MLNSELTKLINYLHDERETYYRIYREPGTNEIYQAYARGRFVQCEAIESFVNEMLKCMNGNKPKKIMDSPLLFKE